MNGSVGYLNRRLIAFVLISPVLFWVFINLSPWTVWPDSIFKINKFTLQGSSSFFDGWSTRVGESEIHVVVEIPAGTDQKWEVNKTDGLLVWELKKGKRRIIQYLPYLVNYGMVPRTLFPKELGGDGDPLDVLLLGPSLPRGTVTVGRIIGVLKLLDGGERDDKLVAVWPDSPFGKVKKLKEMSLQFPGVLSILEIWFKNYKGPESIKSKGYFGIRIAEDCDDYDYPAESLRAQPGDKNGRN